MLKQWKDFSFLLNDFYSISFIILCSMTFEMGKCCKFHAKCNGIECKEWYLSLQEKGMKVLDLYKDFC